MEEEDGDDDDDDDDDDDEEEEDDEDAEEENQRRYDFRQRKTVVRYQAPLDGRMSTFLTKYAPAIAPFRVKVVVDALEHGDMQTFDVSIILLPVKSVLRSFLQKPCLATNMNSKQH